MRSRTVSRRSGGRLNFCLPPSRTTAASKTLCHVRVRALVAVVVVVVELVLHTAEQVWACDVYPHVGRCEVHLRLEAFFRLPGSDSFEHFLCLVICEVHLRL